MADVTGYRQTITYARPPDGGWELAAGRPTAPLRGLIHGYEGYRERLAQPMRRRELPSARVTMIVNFGSPYRLLDPDAPDDAARAVEQRGGFMAGLDDTYAVTESAGDAHCLQIDLAPLAAYRLLGQPMSEIAGRVLALEDVLGAEAELLAERLAGLPTWEDRFALLDRALGKRLSHDAMPSSEIVWAWRQLAASGGNIQVSLLAEELGWSPKRLIARFREQVGLPPKQTARLLRFQRAVHRLRAGDVVDWGIFARDHGFYDQAHLINEFQRMAGDTPHGLLRRCLPADGGFRNE